MVKQNKENRNKWWNTWEKNEGHGQKSWENQEHIGHIYIGDLQVFSRLFRL
jgi:hypothetical protein